MIIFVFTLILTIYGAMNWVIARTLVNQWPHRAWLIYIIVMLLAFCTVLTLMIQKHSVTSVVGMIGSYWMAISFLGFIVYGLCMFIPKNTFWFSTIVLVGIIILGVSQAEKIHTISYDLTLNRQTDKMKIALVSDVHLGYVNGSEKLKKIVQAVNKEKPDAVLIAGDLFDSNFKAIRHVDAVREALNSFESEYGTFLAWGNHDAGDNFDMMKKFIETTNITLLEDEMEDVGPFYIIGRRDLRPIGNQGDERLPIAPLLEQAEEDKPIFLMDHQPVEVDQYEERIDVTLSGHTHRGQIFPFNYITQAIFPIDYGVLDKGNGRYSVVTSGAGFWGPPIRLGTKSEVVMIYIN